MGTNNLYVLKDEDLAGRVHPGEILQDELRERKISQKDFAGQIGMQPSHLSALIHGARNVTADIANRLEKALGIPAYVWMNIQSLYTLGRKQPATDSRVTYSYPGVESAMPAALCEDSPAYGSGRVAKTIHLPAKDQDFLLLLAEKMGWDIM